MSGQQQERDFWAAALQMQAERIEADASGLDVLGRLAAIAFRSETSSLVQAKNAYEDAAQLLRERAAELRLPRVIE